MALLNCDESVSDFQHLDLYTVSERRQLASRLFAQCPIKIWDNRLLRILPGDDDEDGAVTLHQAAILPRNGLGLYEEDRIVPYEALSYTWGKPIFSHKIMCGSLPFSVTANLYKALLHLRRIKSDRWVWIDALCINQDDLDEKARQIGNMFNIYGKAARAVVWLGSCSTETAATIDLIKAVAEIRPFDRYKSGIASPASSTSTKSESGSKAGETLEGGISSPALESSPDQSTTYDSAASHRSASNATYQSMYDITNPVNVKHMYDIDLWTDLQAAIRFAMKFRGIAFSNESKF